MHKPKPGERVKIVDDTCEHSIRLGSIVKISERRTGGEESWWISGHNVFVLAEDITRLGPSISKTLKNLETSVKASVKEAIGERPELKTAVLGIVDEIAEELRGNRL